MKTAQKNIKSADGEEVESREREIKLLFNIIKPDPDYQPIFTSDEATILDSTGHDADVVTTRLEFYFKFDCSSLPAIPIWQAIDKIKRQLPGWPEDWEAPHH